MIEPEDMYLFDLQGFLILRNVLSTEEVATLNEVFDREAVGAEGKPTRGLWRPLERHQGFRDLLDHPRVLPYLQTWVDAGVRADLIYGAEYSNGAPGDNLHLGGTPYSSLCSYNCRNGRIHLGLTVVSYALTDVPGTGEGGFACIPGSHKANTDVSPDIRRFERNPDGIVHNPQLNAGDAVIFTEALTHGTLPWKHDFVRRVLFYRYAPGFMIFEPHPAPPELLEQLTPQQRRMLEPPYGRKPKLDDEGNYLGFERREPV